MNDTLRKSTCLFPIIFFYLLTCAQGQAPRPPFPYQVRDVEYWNADKSIHYGATLTCPMDDLSNPGNLLAAQI